MGCMLCTCDYEVLINSLDGKLRHAWVRVVRAICMIIEDSSEWKREGYEESRPTGMRRLAGRKICIKHLVV